MNEIFYLNDRFFKDTFSYLNNTQSFLKICLPPNILEDIIMDTLTLTQDSFVSPRMSQRFADLVFSVKSKSQEELRISILFEHKSAPERHAAFYLGRYIMRFWSQDMRNLFQMDKAQRRDIYRKPLQAVITILFYHGRKKWNIPNDLHSLVQGSEVYRNYMPQFHFILFDLSKHTEEEFSENKHLQMRMMVFMYDQLRKLKKKLPSILSLIAEMGAQGMNIEDILTAVLTYLMNTNSKLSYEEIIYEVEKTLVKPGVTTMPTIAEKLRAEGRMEGIEQGRLNRTHEVIEMIIINKFGGLDEDLSEQLRQVKDLKVLENLILKSTIATRMEEIREAMK